MLQDCTGDEFIIFMKLLSHLKVLQTLQGRKQLIEIVCDQMEMDKSLDVRLPRTFWIVLITNVSVSSSLQVSDPDNVDRLLQCFRQALPHFSVSYTGVFCAYVNLDTQLPTESSTIRYFVSLSNRKTCMPTHSSTTCATTCFR